MKEQVRYKNEFSVENTNKKITAACNAIAFYNKGVIDVKINNFPLPAGQSFSIGGNENEIDVTEYNLDFGDSPAGILWIVRKYNL